MSIVSAAPGIAPGNQPGIGPGSCCGACSTIVGNALRGDSPAQFNFLDLGDGEVLKSTIEGASSGDVVCVNPGTYTFGSSFTAPIGIPNGVVVKGSGKSPSGTVVQVKQTGDQGAFTLGNNSELWDLRINYRMPTGATSGSTALVDVSGVQVHVQDLWVQGAGAFSAAQAGNTTLRAIVEMSGDKNYTTMREVFIVDFGDLQTEASVDLVGFSSAQAVGNPGALIHHLVVRGCDVGIDIPGTSKRMNFRDIEIDLTPHNGLIGARLTAMAYGLLEGAIKCNADASAVGILCGSGTVNSDVRACRVIGSGNNGVGIDVNVGDVNAVLGNRVQDFDTNLNADAGANNNAFAGNVLTGFGTAAIADAGTNTSGDNAT